jgi:T4 superinfection immunity protein/uncharacterized protein DUF2510
MQDATNGYSTAPVPTTPAGWYPLGGELRYWDGYRWTEHRAAPPTPALARPAVVQHVHYQPAARTYVVSDAHVNGAALVFAWVFAVMTLGYLLPWAVAATRGKSNSGAIALLNLLLGWSVVGWVVALVMACGSHQAVSVRE